jgi:hypothetical protein
MYSIRTGLVFGFHGCDESTVSEVIQKGGHLTKSINKYDWLGTGIYFWENDPERAKVYAADLKNASLQIHKTVIKHPAVIGAVIKLGYCLDLLDYKNLRLVKLAYEILDDIFQSSNRSLPQNRTPKGSSDILIRELDCRVINTLHTIQRFRGQPPFDSVRAAFWEGNELYPNAGFKEKNHIQICIRNPNCIKGYFLPRKSSSNYSKV